MNSRGRVFSGKDDDDDDGDCRRVVRGWGWVCCCVQEHIAAYVKKRTTTFRALDATKRGKGVHRQEYSHIISYTSIWSAARVCVCVYVCMYVCVSKYERK